MKKSNMRLVQSTRNCDHHLLDQALIDLVKDGNKVEMWCDLIEPYEIFQISTWREIYNNGFISKLEFETEEGESFALVSSF